MASRRFVIGDIHGAHEALVQCFDRSSFNKEDDLLVCLGDISDGWPEIDKVFNKLLGVKNLVLILGNHDEWALNFFLTGYAPEIWLVQGGDNAVDIYKKGVPEAHLNLLQQARLYFVLENKLFVHGGILIGKDIELQAREILLWDRSLIQTALYHKTIGKEIQLTDFEEIYVGHTPTLNFNATQPIKACEVYLMDTGAGWPGGVLTMMDIDSKKIFQSDQVDRLYKGVRGRL
jgi:serine/threonine protein phosphatase 1